MKRSLAPVALVALFLVPASAADERPLEARSIQHDGETWLRGAASVVWVDQQDRLPEWQLVVEAAKMNATQYNRSYYNGPTVGPYATSTPYAPDEPVRYVDGEDVTLRVAEQDHWIRVQVLPLEEGGHLQVENTAMAPVTKPMADLELGPSGPAPATGTAADARRDDQNGFTYGAIPGPFAFTQAQDPSTVLTVRGDLMVEVRGLDVQYEDGSGPTTLYGTSRTEPVSEGVPSTVARVEHEAFLRIRLTDAVLRLQAGSADGGHKIAFTSADAMSRGGAVLHDSDGRRDIRLLDTEPFHMEAGDDTLQVSRVDPGALAGLADEGLLAQSTMADPTRGPGATGILAMLAVTALILASALGVYVLRARSARKVDMPHVEAALETGQYGEAARLAKRVIRRDPFRDGAAIALAVAYTRGGKPAAAVRAAKRHIKIKEPADGVLHYVMGLALLDLGHQKEAQDALVHAVDRTPALSDAVEERLDLMEHDGGAGPEGVAYV